MGSEWKECELGDVLELKRGYDLPKTKREDGVVPVISSSGESGEHNEYKVSAPGVVTGRYGTIGQVFYVEDNFWPLNTTLYVRDFKGNDPLFIYYFLKTVSYKDYTDKAAVPGINRNHLHKAKVRIPICPKYQNRLASQLRAFDKKISLNNQINQTLEQMAQTLFKSWFVDFDPVIDNALDAGSYIPEIFEARVECRKAVRESADFKPLPDDIRQLFPEKLIESEEGLIPDGWELTKVGKVSECFDKHRVPLSKKQREERRGSIPYYGATSVMDYVDEAIFDDIYLLIGEDGSVVKLDGTPFIQYIWGPAWINNHAHVLKGINSVSTEQLMLFFQQTNINAYVTGAVQLKINQRNMNSIPFVKATEEINERFYDFIAPLYAKIRAIKEENEQLTKLRDTLLPKLISGELRLDSPEVEQAKALVD
ncbi:restriction endonuclease subunit S [Vibrio rotiferianus]|uniref:restriction endonuclease subunit S n=1 Tax=Vibrio rotiferianus TaxID=190895 RepID=UPI00148C2965|nr:restriction endonuclease subunit S [Vibrio rotiferianus]NOH67314.1 restriction endonuclease subunit S [Vibrio rotiferianus]